MSSPWLTVFDHRFVGPSLSNCRHFPGRIDVSPFAPAVHVEPMPDGILSYYTSLSSLPPRWFRYAPTRLFPDVVGIELDLSLRLARFILLGHSFVLAESDHWAFRVQDNGRIEMIFRGQSTGWNGFQHNPEAWLDVRWSWRINGQSLLRVNGDVVSVVPGVNVGSRSVMSYLWIGSNVIQPPGGTSPLPGTRSTPFYSADIRCIRVRLLTEERVKRFLDTFIPLTEADKERIEACKQPVEGQIQAFMAVLRDLMSAVLQKESRAWLKEHGGNPVSRSASEMHKHAREVALAAAGYLNGNDGEFTRFELHANQFFNLLASILEDITEFTSRLKTILGQNERIPEDCKEVINEIRGRYARQLRRVEVLKGTLIKIIEQAFRIGFHG